MKVCRTTLAQANAFVAEHHRHNRPCVGAVFSLGAEHDGSLIGVAIAGRPVARMLDDGRCCEALRVCSMLNAPKGTNSFLYGAVRRAAAALGFRMVITYTLSTESGASLRGAGWRGWKNDLGSILIECKASRSDFLADRHKHFRRNPERSMGRLRYYLAPEGVCQDSDMPEGWGLLVVRGQRVHTVHPALPQTGSRQYEIDLLVSALRRVVGPGVQGVRCRIYQIDGQGEPRATLGVVGQQSIEMGA